VSDPVPGNVPDELRADVAWLMYCLDQGYANRADRDILTNWLLEDPATLHPDDQALRPHLLAMADEVIAAVRRQLADDERQLIDALSAMLASKYRHDTDWLLVNIRGLRNTLEASRVAGVGP